MSSPPDRPSAAQDEYAMRLALDQALNAQLAGEVPVGAVIMRNVDGVPQVTCLPVDIAEDKMSRPMSE